MAIVTMIQDFGILYEIAASALRMLKILKPAFGNYALVSIFAVLFEERG